MAKVKYIYDYPANRDVSKHLGPGDRAQIAFRSGYTVNYVREWCRGTRRNKRIEEWARRIMKMNIANQRKLDKSSNPSSN